MRPSARFAATSDFLAPPSPPPPLHSHSPCPQELAAARRSQVHQLRAALASKLPAARIPQTALPPPPPHPPRLACAAQVHEPLGWASVMPDRPGARRWGPPLRPRGVTRAASPPPPLPPPPRTKWTRRVPHPVRIGHASSPGAGPAETTSPSSGAPRPRVRRAVRARRSRSRSTAGFLTRCGRFTRGTSSRWGRAASGLRPSRPPCTCGTPPGRHVLRRAGGGAPRVDGALHRGRARRPAPARSAPRGSGAEAKHSSRR